MSSESEDQTPGQVPRTPFEPGSEAEAEGVEASGRGPSSLPPAEALQPQLALTEGPEPISVPESGNLAPVRGEVWIAVSLLLLFPVLGLVTAGELGAFLGASIQALPFALLSVFAYLGVDRPWARLVARVWLVLVLMVAFGMVFTLSVQTQLVDPDAEVSKWRIFPDAWTDLISLAVAGICCVWAACAPLTRTGRRLLARFTGGEEWSEMRLIALSAVLGLAGLSLLPLCILGDPPMLMFDDDGSGGNGGGDDGRGAGGMLRDEVYGLCWVLVSAAFAVGYGICRNGREVLVRLGLVRPTARSFVMAVGLTVMLLAVAWAVDWGLDWFWVNQGWATTSGEDVDKLFDYAATPLGAVVVGIVAGLGEEVAVRGILQPRLGLMVSSLFFAAIHGLQYQWDGLISVLVVGIFLGLVRKRSNTTMSAMVHAMYDFVILLQQSMDSGN